MRAVILSMLIVAAACSLADAQGDRLPIQKIHQAASDALRDFSAIAKQSDVEAMGFRSPGEAQEARLGDPMPVYMVRLDDLQDWRPGTNPDKLLRECREVIYPVKVADGTRSSVSVENSDGVWTASSLGGANLMSMLETAVKASAAATTMAASSFFVVHVPALNMYFVGYRNPELMLSPAMDDPDLGFRVGQALPADRVFSAIAPAARTHQGEPG